MTPHVVVAVLLLGIACRSLQEPTGLEVLSVPPVGVGTCITPSKMPIQRIMGRDLPAFDLNIVRQSASRRITVVRDTARHLDFYVETALKSAVDERGISETVFASVSDTGRVSGSHMTMSLDQPLDTTGLGARLEARMRDTVELRRMRSDTGAWRERILTDLGSLPATHMSSTPLTPDEQKRVGLLVRLLKRRCGQ